MISRCAVGGVEFGGMEVRACESGENPEYGKGNRRRFYDGFYPYFSALAMISCAMAKVARISVDVKNILTS